MDDDTARSEIYQGLAEVYEEHHLRALALERAIELTPNKEGLRFSAAYAYSHVDETHPLVVLHYQNDLALDPKSAWSLNNLGICLGSLGLPFKAVEYLRQAVDVGNTLASANLAYRLMDAGFQREAEAELETASKEPNPHENVAQALGNLAARRESEGTRLDAIVDDARLRQPFMRRYAKVLMEVPDSTGVAMSGTWEWAENQVQVVVTQEGNSFEGTWERYGKKYQVRGNVKGRSAEVTFYRMEYYTYDGSERGFEKEADGFAVVSDDEQSVSMLRIKDRRASLLEMNRLVPM